MQEFIECRHILTNGRKCRAAALRDKPFCFHHAKLHFLNSARRTPRELNPSGSGDLGALCRATARALEALSSPIVDSRRAGLLLYGIHLAANLEKRMSAAQTQHQTEKESQQESLHRHFDPPALLMTEDL